MWFQDRSDRNQAVQSQKQARSLKFQIQEEEELYYLYSKNKGADQLCSYCEAVFAYANFCFSHDAAQIYKESTQWRFTFKSPNRVLYPATRG